MALFTLPDTKEKENVYKNMFLLRRRKVSSLSLRRITVKSLA
jgi:hypothetical protein